jgi:hypothetical protein
MLFNTSSLRSVGFGVLVPELIALVAHDNRSDDDVQHTVM